MRSVTVEWLGDSKEFYEDQVFMAIDAIEEHMTVGDIAAMRARPSEIRVAKLSSAYSSFLTVVGFRVTRDEVLKELQGMMKQEGNTGVRAMLQLLEWLAIVVLDGIPIEPEKKEEDDPGKKQEGVSQPSE